VDWTLRHPDDPGAYAAKYGRDPERGGYWAELVYCDVPVTYDMSDAYDVGSPIRGLLMFLSQFGFVDGHDIDTAFEWLKYAEEFVRRPAQ
jgi:hypothetical protein